MDALNGTAAEVVTPCVGVWIEIILSGIIWCITRVTPCVGVWIEIRSG